VPRRLLRPGPAPARRERASPEVLPPPPPPPPAFAAYESSSTIVASGRTFIYNNEPMDQAGAELFCNTQGGHLASYNSSAEQREVRARAQCRPPST
jgi:hypothetical protein